MIYSEEFNRYQRQIRLPEIGPEGQKRITGSRILVVGAGALGSASLQYLVTAGVGVIGIIDNDILELHNLHRQVLYANEDIGKQKVLAAEKRLKAMNPEISIVSYARRLTIHNALEMIPEYDLVLECSDNFPTKFLVNDACVILNKPCIIGAALGFTGQLSVYNYKNGPTYRCLLPDPPDPLVSPSCADVGVMGMIPGVIGTMQALEAIKIVSGIGDTLSGRLLHFEGLEGRFIEIEITPDPRNKTITQLTEYEMACPDDLLSKYLIDGADFLNRLQDGENHIVIAFSGEDRSVQFRDFSWKSIPLYKLHEALSSVPEDKNILLVCEHGIKSTEALKHLLVKQNFTRAYALQHGLAGLRT
jgi:sulfur-carrier protein adenylyltransferase/sulfurtransferase